MDDLIADFLTETKESLQELDQDIVKLEKNPNDPELISQIFRVMHTIKGTCGFLGLPRLENVAHHGENILGKFRDGDLEVTAGGITLILTSIDRINEIVDHIAETGSEPEGEDSELTDEIKAFIDSGGAAPEKSAATDRAGAEENDESESESTDQAAADELTTAETNAPESPESPESPPVKTVQKAEKTESKKEKKSAPIATTQSIRVNVDVLENLMNIASELVLTRNQLMQIAKDRADEEMESPLQRLNLNVSELQEGVMKTRMQPIGNAWSKLPRIIRDLSHELDKKIELVKEGEETELDRQVLDLIRDPLTHMVRNSADHGIEQPEERLAAGKPETGVINLSAYHEGGHIIIEIADDGKGLNLEAIKKKALERGIMSEEALEEAPKKQIQNLIFNPGFSTAAAVTAVSGRGVGMDVVRSNIEKIGGTVDLESTEGEGSKFTIKIPLTLAIVSALIVEVGPEKFAVPQINVTELVRVSEENRIENIRGSKVLRLRNELLPLINLKQIMKLDNGADNRANDNRTHLTETTDKETADLSEEPSTDTSIAGPIAGRSDDKINDGAFIVVLQIGNNALGVIVDRVHDMEEIVVKPVSPVLRQIELFSGNTILGDGSIIMILDPNGLSKAAGDINAGPKQARTLDSEEEMRQARLSQKESVLLFRAGEGPVRAVPLNLVGRLEEFEISDIEMADNHHVIQYRGRLMPLVPFDPAQTLPKEGHQPVLVFFDTDTGRAMGLMVDQIVDILEENITIERSQGTPGLLGSAIIKGKATDLIDVSYYINRATGSWFNSGEGGAFNDGTASGPKRVLMVDDSPFFRNMLIPFLKVSGYDVTSVENPAEAIALRDEGATYDVIISDIEMPGITGFEFAQIVREDGPWQHTPMVALSSHATQSDMQRGEEVGFDNFVAKFDRDMLLEALEDSLKKESEAA